MAEMDTNKTPAKPDDAFAVRVKYFKRVLARGVGRTPPVLLRMALKRAAELEAVAEATLADPNSTANDKVRTARAVRLARRDLAEMIATTRGAAYEPSMAEMLARTL